MLFGSEFSDYLSKIIKDSVSDAIKPLIIEISNLKESNRKLQSDMAALNSKQGYQKSTEIAINKKTCTTEKTQKQIKELDKEKLTKPKENPSVDKENVISKMSVENSLTNMVVKETRSNEEKDFTEVTYKKKRKEIIGTAAVSETLKAAEKKLWVYLGRVHPETTEDNVLKYLNGKYPDLSFECEKLPTKGKNNSFKIGADIKLENEIYSEDFWPRGVAIKRFHFFRAKQGRF